MMNSKPPVDLNWSELGFTYTKTPYRFQAIWENGHWTQSGLVEDENLHLHEASTVFNYGQSCFEGLKAQRTGNGDVLLFRPDLNAERMQQGARRLSMAEVPTDLFLKAVYDTVKANIDWVPPFGTGASLYIRPVLFGSGPMMSVKSAPQFIFRVFATPVGAYYTGGEIHPISLAVSDYDRAAPHGTGAIKAGGNYAGGIIATYKAKEAGAHEALYLDAATRSTLEEAGTSNILIVTDKGHLITPQSPSILPSVTRKSILELATKMLHLIVEERPIVLRDEIETFKEVAVCGTAAVLAPVSKILVDGHWHAFPYSSGFGPIINQLYTLLTEIQRGDIEDPFGWTHKVS